MKRLIVQTLAAAALHYASAPKAVSYIVDFRLKDTWRRIHAIRHSNCSHFEDGALGRTHHYCPPGTVPAHGRHHEIVQAAFVVEGTVKLGYAETVIIPLGIVLVVSTVLYLVPRTSVLGAILVTGYLGGAVSTHVIAAEGLFPIFFPVVFGILLWLGLYLRDERLRSLAPLRSTASA